GPAVLLPRGPGQSRRTTRPSVGRLAGINLVDPRRYSAADVGGIGETGPFQYRQRFSRTFSGFAVQHSGAVAGNVGQGRAVKEFALGYEFRSGNLVDLALIGLTHVNEYEIPDAVVALFQPRLQCGDADRGVNRGLGSLVADHTAKCVVIIEQSRDRRTVRIRLEAQRVV